MNKLKTTLFEYGLIGKAIYVIILINVASLIIGIAQYAIAAIWALFKLIRDLIKKNKKTQEPHWEVVDE